MAGWITKPLSSLLAAVPRWYAADDGSQMPAHASMLVDVTGTPIPIAPNPNLCHRFGSSTASVNAVTFKSTPGHLFGIFGYNNSASIRYLRLINKNNGNPAGDLSMMILRLKPQDYFTFSWPAGFYFSNALCRATTTDNAVTSSSAVDAGDLQDVHFYYA